MVCEQRVPPTVQNVQTPVKYRPWNVFLASDRCSVVDKTSVSQGLLAQSERKTKAAKAIVLVGGDVTRSSVQRIIT